ncbi:hypothetical protein D9M70_564310 [compost metagenome]
MGLDRAQADEQRLGDLLIILSPGHAAQHILLAAGEGLDQTVCVVLAPQPAQQWGEAFAGWRLIQAELLAGLRQQQLAQEVGQLAAFVMQQLTEAVPLGQPQGMIEAAQGSRRVILILV